MKKRARGAWKKSTKKKAPIMSVDDSRFRGFMMSVLRQASRYWKPSQTCITNARIARGLYVCSNPECSKVVGPKDIKKDHTDPVIPLSGFTNWHDIIVRMFASEDKYNALCTTCHDAKTKQELEIRKSLKKK